MKRCKISRGIGLMILLSTVLHYPVKSQHKDSGISCCQNASIKAFTDLAMDVNFMIAHDEPLDFQYQDQRGKMIEFPTSGDKKGIGYLVSSPKKSNIWVFVFHEWWGLNDYIKRQADEIQKDIPEANVMALDLYDGRSGSTREEAASLMQRTSAARVEQIINGAAAYCGNDAKFYTIGWCFGGAWSHKAAIMLGASAKACIIYYGMPVTDSTQLKMLQADVLGIFGSQDKSINPDVVARFKEAMEQNHRNLELHVYDAPHAFANPSNPKYNQEFSQDAWKKSMAFLRKRL